MIATVITRVFAACPPMFGATLAVDYLIYFGAILLITTIAALWFISTRRPVQHSDRRPRHRSSSKGWFSAWFGNGEARGASGRKRRRRREHRKRNPTLAETGGLPPIRRETSSSGEDPQP